LYVLYYLPLGQSKVWQVICNRNCCVSFPTVWSVPPGTSSSARYACFRDFRWLFQIV